MSVGTGMGIDAVTAIGARLTQIRSLVADVSPSEAGPTGSSTSSASGFEAALARALASGPSGSSGSSASGGWTTLGDLAGGATALGGLAGGVLGLGLLTTSPPPGATAAGTGALTADGVPADLAAYGNGRVPESVLVPVAGSRERLWAPAAASLDRLRGAAAADGVTIGVTDGYRSYDAQADLVRRKGLYSEGGLAAVPGTSEHGWGMAADLALDSSGLAWMRANADRFGFAETTPREPWHWGYRPTS